MGLFDERARKAMERKAFFRAIAKGNGPAVYALVNSRSKSVYVVGAVDFIASFARNASLIGRRAHRNRALNKARGALTFKLLERLEAASLCEIKKAAWAAHYKALGYRLYNKEHIGRYRSRIGISPNMKPQVQVISGGKRIWGGREFATLEEAEAFHEGLSIEDAIADIKERLC